MSGFLTVLVLCPPLSEGRVILSKNIFLEQIRTIEKHSWHLKNISFARFIVFNSLFSLAFPFTFFRKLVVCRPQVETVVLFSHVKGVVPSGDALKIL